MLAAPRTAASTLLDQLGSEAARDDSSKTAQATAAVLIADVSGFTALTATLEARHGVRGADIISATMDRLLGGLAQIAEEHGGLVVDFIGDAIHALWVESDTQTLDQARATAAAAAQVMLGYAAATAEDQLTTPIRIGIACGPVQLAMIGGFGGRWERLSIGPALLKAGVAVARTPTSCCQIGGDPGWQSIASQNGAESNGETWWLLRHQADSVASAQTATMQQSASIDAAAWTAELRLVTVMFCRLVSADEMARVSIERVNRLARVAQQVIEQHGGLIDKIHADDKGISVVIAFGIQGGPGEADRGIKGGTALRCVLAAIDLRRALADLGTETAIGIATGKVRVGVGDTGHGSCHTMYGNAVNFAARCMQACRDEILCDDITRDASATSVNFFSPEARQLKGLETGGAIFGVGAIKEERDAVLVSDITRIAGRRREQASISIFLDSEAIDRPRTMIIDGDDGAGKSRLVGFAVEQASRRKLDPIVCRASLLGTKSPLLAWREPMALLLRRYAREHNLTLGEAQDALVIAAGGGADEAALVGSLFGREGVATLITDGEVDASSAKRLRGAVAAALLGDEPRLIILEDAHWLDDTSLALARDLLRLLPELSVIFVARKPVPAAVTKAAGASFISLSLANLDRRECAELAMGLLGPFDTKHPFVEWLHTRSAGNPMFCRALIALLPEDFSATALSTPGAWRKAKVSLESADMPATIEGALLVRFANLPPTQLGLLKAASVTADRFGTAMLITLGTPSSPDQIDLDLAALVEAGILTRTDTVERPEWRFSEQLTREVIYNSLPKQLLVQLHRRAAQFLECPSDGGNKGDAAQIAHHWLEGDMPAKAFAPLRKAGVEAKQAGAYATALTLWKTALDLIETDQAGARGKGPYRRAIINRDLAFVSWRLGEPAQTIAYCYDSMNGLWSGAPSSQTGWWTMLGREAIALGWQMLDPFRRGQTTQSAEARLKDRLRLGNSVRLIEAFYFSVGALPAATMALYAARTAERLGEKAFAARPYGFLGYLAGTRKLHKAAQFLFQRSRQDCIAAKDWSSLAQSVNGEAMYHLTNGRWDIAIRRSRFVATLSRRRNRNADIASPTTFIGLGYLMAGSFKQMRNAFEQVEAVAFAKSNDHYLLFHRSGFGQIELAEGRPEVAEALLINGQALAKRVRDLHSSLIVEGLLAVSKLRLGKVDEVVVSAETLLMQADATPMINFGSWYGFAAVAEALVGVFAAKGPGKDGEHRARAKRAVTLLFQFSKLYPVAVPLASLFSGQYAMLCNRPDRAMKRWQIGIRAAETADMKYDLARLFAAMGAVPTLEMHLRADHRRQAGIWMERCELATLPPLLLNPQS
ncbi:MAG: AAA family ATPase [Pseudomonadota bacterium]